MSRRQLMRGTKAKIRAAQLALWSNPEFKEAQRQKHLGYKHTEETKRKSALQNRH